MTTVQRARALARRQHRPILAAAAGVGAREDSAAWVLGLNRHWRTPIELVVPRRVGGDGPKGIDVVHRVMPETLRLYLQNSERQGFDIRRLEEPGIPRNLRAALDLYVRGSGLTANELEALFYELRARAGLPMPKKQAPFGDQNPNIRVDFIWKDIGLIVETDGRDGHFGWVAATEDRYQPEMVMDELRAAHARLQS